MEGVEKKDFYEIKKINENKFNVSHPIYGDLGTYPTLELAEGTAELSHEHKMQVAKTEREWKVESKEFFNNILWTFDGLSFTYPIIAVTAVAASAIITVARILLRQ